MNQRESKKKQKANEAQTFGAETPVIDDERRSTDIPWLIGCFAITAVAVFVRFYDLTLKPLHHDEGVNGFFLTTLFRDGVYKYDPSNYHGPTLYYIALFFSNVFGLETFSVRASVGVFGVAIVAMAFFLRKYIGATGSLVAAFLLALSPGMVYISRYFIHEIFFVFCSFGIVLGGLFFIEGRKPGAFAVAWMSLLLLVCFLPPALNLVTLFDLKNPTAVWVMRAGFFLVEAILVFLVMRMLSDWRDGRPMYLMLASASAALFFATKETAFITVGTMLIACACVWIWRKIYGGMFEGNLGADDLSPVALTWQTFRERLGGGTDLMLTIVAVVVVFLYVSVLCFSSFFTHADGVVDAVRAYAFWTKTGTGDHTQNGLMAYGKWLLKIESPILFLSAIGTLIAFVKAKHRFAMFAGLWAFGLFAAYTIIPYKTPWLALSFILPMCIVAGYGVNEMFVSVKSGGALKGIAALLTTLSIGILGYQTWDINFLRYDDDTMPYIYAHTRRGFLDMIREIDRYAEKSGKAREATIEIVSPDYWPMPWYTKNYSRANYHGRIVPANTAEMIVAKKGDQDDEIKLNYAAHYKLVGEYQLRPGVDLVLLVRRDLADPAAKEISDSSLNNFDSNEPQAEPLEVR